MKKYIIIILITILLISCSSSSNGLDVSNSPLTQSYNWQFKLNGVLYKWSGGLYDESGQNHYKVGSKKLNLVKGNLNLIILFPSASTGNFTFNSSTPSEFSLYFYYTNMNIDVYDTNAGGTMNVNVSSISSNSYSSNSSNPGKVIGTFSGTLKKQGGQLSTITDGYFEVLNF